jgi:transcriptional regulator with XRE-family HTH domain
MSPRKRPTFGEVLRAKRLAYGHSLRKFAELVGVSPTYLSLVEQGNCDPPTAERVQKIAKLLGENADKLIALAGRMPEDLAGIIRRRPTELPELLRAARDLTPEQLRRLTAHARRLRGKGD